MKTGIDTIWEDRKRILGMPISMTKYYLSEDRLFVQTGLISMKIEETLLYRVSDISVRVGLFQRIFGVGTIIIHSSDKSTPHIDLVNVKEPLVVKELIHKHVEVMKVSRNIRVSEFLDDGPTAPDPCTHAEHKSSEKAARRRQAAAGGFAVSGGLVLPLLLQKLRDLASDGTLRFIGAAAVIAVCLPCSAILLQKNKARTVLHAAISGKIFFHVFSSRKLSKPRFTLCFCCGFLVFAEISLQFIFDYTPFGKCLLDAPENLCYT